VIAVGKYGMVGLCRARLIALDDGMDGFARALPKFRQRGGGVVVVALVVASRTMLQSVVDPNSSMIYETLVADS